jgi:outer membrane protein TolC
MRRWLTRLAGMFALCFLGAGCKQQMFLSQDCFTQANELLPPVQIENDYDLGTTPLINATKSPPTLADPDRPPRFMTLHEAFAIALENGSISDAGGSVTGNVNDILPSFLIQNSVLGFNNQSTDRVKALALNPAIAGANLEASLSRFDAQWVTAMNWSATDNIQQGLASFSNGNTGALSTALVKGMSSGGVATLGFENNYRMLTNNPASALSPLYESRLNIGFEQPLWRDFGTDINQVLARFPSFNGTGAAAAAASYNARQNSGSTIGVGTEGILISRVRLEMQKAEFERRIHNLLCNVEIAYWRLYQAYGRMHTAEELLRVTHELWQKNYEKLVVGKADPSQSALIRGQYEDFRRERMQALGNVLEVERNLRGILGMPPEDGSRLVPIDAPTVAPYQPNWDASVQMALMQKPELAIARENLRVAQFTLVSQKNFLKPDLRAVARYSPVGFGTRLDGNAVLPIDANTPPSNFGRTDNALRSLASGEFADWNIGLTLSVPLGFRLEHAAVRMARLQLAQAYYVLQDAEQRTQRALAREYEKVSEWYDTLQPSAAARQAYADAVDVRVKIIRKGRETLSLTDIEALRRLSDAKNKEYEATAEYNIALAQFEHRRGNTLKHNNVIIAETGLPVCAEVRAVEHERDRAKAILLRERPDPVRTPGRLAGQITDLPARLDLPGEESSRGPASSMPMARRNPAGVPLQGTNSPEPALTSAPMASPSNAIPAAGKSIPVETNEAPLYFRPVPTEAVVQPNIAPPANNPAPTMFQRPAMTPTMQVGSVGAPKS